jgi:hypothetical protein
LNQIDRGTDVYTYLYTGRTRDNFRSEVFSVSFSQVFNQKEVRMLIVSGSLKQAADYISFYHLGFSTVNENTPDPHYLWPYFFGGMLGTALVGPLYDFCHSGAGYIALNTLTIITVAGQVISIIVLMSGKTSEEYVTTFE